MRVIPGAVLGAAVLLSGSLLASTRQGAQTPARDAITTPGRPAGSGSIAGAILTDDGSPQPVKRAMVTVTPADGGAPKIVFSNDSGRFTVSDLPPGRYLVVATKGALVKTAFGATRSDRPGTPVSVAAGQQVSNLVLRMPHGAVLTGRVTDENGQPAVSVLVRVSVVRAGVGGERPLAGPASGPATDLTDDRGAYRIYGLPAGDYVVSALPRGPMGGEIRQTTAADVASVQRAIQAASTPGAGQPSVPPPAPVTVNYTTVYYPSATDVGNATPITLTPGEERDGVDLSLQLVRTARINGTVVTPEGVSPQRVQLLLVPNNDVAGLPMAISLNRVAVGPDGKFSYPGVAPGKYSLTARATAGGGNGANAAAPGPGPGKMGFGPAAGGPVLWGLADVTVNGEDVDNVTIALQPGLTMTGRITTDAQGVAAPDLSRAQIALAPSSIGGGLMLGAPVAYVDAGGKFSMPDITPGRYRINASLQAPGATWTARSMIVKGRDVLDFPLEIGPTDDLSNVTVTFTNQTQEISGRLEDVSGRPAPDYTIVVFPADQALWVSPRRVRTTRPGTDGHFTVPGLPAGEYHIAAVVDIAPNEATDPAFLNEINTASVPITLHDGDHKVQDLKIG